MSRLTFFFPALLLALWTVPSQAQAPASDPEGVAILTQSLSASGAAAIPVQSFTANGTITFFWAGDQVQGLATIRARGHDQFRLDANLPSGTRSVALSGNSGARKEADGKLTEIPVHNTMSMGGSSFPYLAMAAALSDSTFTVSYVGSVQSGDQQLQQVRTTKNLPAAQDPEGVITKLSRTDYFVDSQTNLVVKTADLTHPIETLTENYPREVELEDYRAFGGVAVSTVVREKINGQAVWEFHLSTISFNTELTDADFTIH